MRALKLGLSLSSIVLSVGILVTHATDSLYPGLTFGVLFSSLILLLTAFDASLDRFSMRSCLAAVLVLSIAYRTYVFLFPASLVGLDPFSYAIQVQRVMERGTTSAIEFFFYSKAPLSIVYPAMSGMLAGLPASESLIVYPIFIGVLVPLSVAVLTISIASRDTFHKAILAALLAATALVSVHYAYWPIAQTLAVAYWCVFVVLLSRYYEVRSKRSFFLAAILLIALSFTHKLPLLVVSSALLLLASSSMIQKIIKKTFPNETANTFNRRPIGLLFAALSGTILLVQWSYITEFIIAVVRIGIGILVNEPTVSPPLTDTHPAAAVTPLPGILGVLVRRGHGLVLIPIAGLAWFYIIYTRGDNSTAKVLLASSAVSMALLGLVVINTGDTSEGPSNPGRLLFFAEPLLIPFIAAVFGRMSPRRLFDRIPVRRVAATLSTALLVFVIVSQVYSGLAVPDFRDTPRMYLTAQEVDAKEFGHEYIEGPIHTDWYYTTTVLQPGGQRNQYREADKELLNANLTEKGYDYIAYRRGVDVYPTSVGPWRLTWKPESELDSRYDRVYTDGGVLTYRRSAVVRGDETARAEPSRADHHSIDPLPQY